MIVASLNSFDKKRIRCYNGWSKKNRYLANREKSHTIRQSSFGAYSNMKYSFLLLACATLCIFADGNSENNNNVWDETRNGAIINHFGLETYLLVHDIGFSHFLSAAGLKSACHLCSGPFEIRKRFSCAFCLNL
jgi:hypothetical protein